MTFSERMKYARELKKITLKNLGNKIGKTEATVQRYESGEIKNLKNDIIEAIADALDVSPAYLMGWDDTPLLSENTMRVAAHIEDDVTEEELEEIMRFIDYIKSRRK
ncbi:helix-turn-helix domain-containing protein [Globicatella sanguinis]|uniref:helix-turn-helix domain-containing protein n=1 Tax=Globicatella sanguinis TaxID=13076 RepID=UPI0008242FE2|nr:helix-turn-helix transcriptional regulator [Globicatella sanguinis]